MTYIVQYGSDMKLIFDNQIGGVSCVIDLIGLIGSTDFNQLWIDLKLVIIDFKISLRRTC